MLVKGLAILALSVVLAATLMESSRGDSHSPGGRPAASRPTQRPPRSRRRLTTRRAAMMAEQKEELKEFAEKHMPELWKQYQQLQEEDPPGGRRLLQGVYWLWRRVRRYPVGEIREAAIARHRLGVEIYKTVRAYRQSEDQAEKTRLRKELAALVGQRFDYDLIVKEYDVKRLEKQLADLKAEIGQDKRERKEHIEASVNRMLKPRPSSRPAEPGSE